MKKFIQLLILVLFIQTNGQSENQLIIKETAHKLGIKESHIFHKLIVLKELKKGIVIVIPEIYEEGQGYIALNSHVLLIDKVSHSIKASFSQQKDWFIDAIRINKISIKENNYQLNKTNELTFSLFFEYSGGNRVNTFHGKLWSLFELKKNQLNRLLKQFSTRTFDSETDTTCKGKSEEHYKKIIVQKNKTNNYKDIKVFDRIKSYSIDENCTKNSFKDSLKISFLKYNGKIYKIMN